jgi:membrane protease YdiL (CAAX protease family)
MKPTAPPQSRRRFARPNLLTSLILVFPLFLVYQVGVLALPQVYNGADLITSELLRLLHGQRGYYLLVNGVLLIAFLVLLAVMRRKNEFHARQFIPVVLESALYAVSMGTLIVFVMRDVLHVNPNLQIAAAAAAAQTAAPQAAPVEHVGLLAKIVLAFGAGVHEELVFRLLMIPGLIAIFTKVVQLRRWIAVTFAFLVSSILFSAAHHVIGGEAWHVWPFVYRFFCGMIFATLFEVRGFAVAVYTHALYDIFVLALHG